MSIMWSAIHKNKDECLHHEDGKAPLVRGVAPCDFWLSPLATALLLLLDTLPGCPLACHLFKPPPSLPPSLLPEATSPAMSKCGELIDVCDTCFREPPSSSEMGRSVSIFEPVNVKVIHWAESREKKCPKSTVFDGSDLRWLFPAAFTVAMKRAQPLHS